jgi:hypothetical protein
MNLDTKYFEGYPNNYKLKDLYIINQEVINRLNIDINDLIK